MKTKLLLLALIAFQVTFSKGTGSGSISLVISNKTIEIPVFSTSIRMNHTMTIQARGQTIVPMDCRVFLSIDAGQLAANPFDINTANCFLTLAYINERGEQIYSSFDFAERFPIYVTRKDSISIFWTSLMEHADLSISHRDAQGNVVFIMGTFAYRQLVENNFGKNEKRVEILNGRFSLACEAAEEIPSISQEAREQEIFERLCQITIPPPYIYSISSPSHPEAELSPVCESLQDSALQPEVTDRPSAQKVKQRDHPVNQGSSFQKSPRESNQRILETITAGTEDSRTRKSGMRRGPR